MGSNTSEMLSIIYLEAKSAMALEKTGSYEQIPPHLERIRFELDRLDELVPRLINLT